MPDDSKDSVEGSAVYGLRGFTITRKHEKRFDWRWSSFPGLDSHPRVGGGQE